MNILPSTLVKEVPKAASYVALMLSTCSASMSKRLLFASNVRSLILLMKSACSIYWARFWTCAGMFPRRTSMVWTLLRRLLLRLARLDKLVSGAGLMIGGAVYGSRC